MAKVNQYMFREYDIRGLVNNEQLNEKTVYLLGRAYGTYLQRQYQLTDTIIGYDARSYSPDITKYISQGLADTGITVTNIGQVTSPMLYWAQYYLKSKAGVMVTASHNPNGWCGFKLGYDYSTTLGPKEIQELYKLIINEDFISGLGEIKKCQEDITQAYGQEILSKIKINRPLKVVVDCGNGTPGPIYPKIIKQAGCQVEELFCNIDTSFPNHEPNPSDANAVKALQQEVLKQKADLGIGFDGDGDRLGIIDEKGNMIGADKFLILLSRRVLAQNPGGKIVFDVKCSQALSDDITAHGGIPVMWKTGHSYIKQKSKEINAVLGGEKSGHIFYSQGFYPHDDALFACLKLLEYVSSQTKTFSQLMADTPQYVTTPTLQADCPDEVKYEIVDKLTAEFKQEYGKDKVIDINGARVVFPDGWGLVRASSNLPVLVMVFEAKTQAGVDKIKQIFKEKMAKYSEINPEWKFG